MLSPLNSPSLATAAPPPSRHSAAPADGEAAGEDFAQALEHAASKQPKAAARERPRGAARLTPGGEAANANNLSKPEPELAPVDGKRGQTLPPQADEEPVAADGSPTPPALAALLAALRAAVPAASTAGALDAAGKSAITPTSATQSDNPKRHSRDTAHGTLSTATGQDAGVATSLATAAAASGRTAAESGGSESGRDSFAQQLAAAAPQSGIGSHADTPFGLPTLLAAAAPGAAAAAAVAVQAEVQLPAAPGSADFGPQLGSQISTFVRDGIEHARLHLNPAEMGPVSVQIQLDGQTALVHLSAENPHTRQALEQAMHLLAGSLREAGLTLTGGGVFERPHQRDGAQAQADAGAGPGEQRERSDGHPGGREGDVLRAEPSSLAARRRGVVDLVA